MIRVKGPRSRDILERICPINIDKDVFIVGSVSRTVMEHIGTIIYRDEDDSYILLTMRSFGRSMIHAIEVSVNNVL
jgi:sarcosine oxidase subunit gamma